MAMYKIFAWLFFLSASLLAISILWWSNHGAPISLTAVAVAIGGLIYISFAIVFISSRFLAVKRELPLLKRLSQRPVVRIISNFALYAVSLGLAAVTIIGVGGWTVSTTFFPVFVSKILEPYATYWPKIDERIANQTSLIASGGFFGRNKYRYDFTDGDRQYRLEFYRDDQNCNGSDCFYHYDFLTKGQNGWWQKVFDAFSIDVSSTIEDFKVTKVYSSKLANPILIATVYDSSYTSTGRNFLLYPVSPSTESPYQVLKSDNANNAIATAFSIVADKDGYPIVTISYGNVSAPEKYKLALDTSEGTPEIIPQLIQN